MSTLIYFLPTLPTSLKDKSNDVPLSTDNNSKPHLLSNRKNKRRDERKNSKIISNKRKNAVTRKDKTSLYLSTTC